MLEETPNASRRAASTCRPRKLDGRKGGIACGRTARCPITCIGRGKIDREKLMDAELRHRPDRRRVVLNHLRSGSNLALLPVFVGFDVLFPFTELRPKKYQLSSRF
ncbi:hypothetical protein RPHASCH2410_CH18245 [Rhizobium phaseoli Ch24-10]|nr:hypothetical protein RPHASCH2410_CH18245 [Rhizobium phaseoli Ch24-10]